MMECPMVADMPHSHLPDDHWVVQTTDGDMAEGPYKHGKRHGLWDFRYADGTKEKVKFRHGKFAEFVE